MTPLGTEVRTFGGEHDALAVSGRSRKAFSITSAMAVSSIAVLGRHQRHVENIVSGEFYANGVGHLRVLTRTRSN